MKLGAVQPAPGDRENETTRIKSDNITLDNGRGTSLAYTLDRLSFRRRGTRYRIGRMDALTAFGLFAVTTMLVTYALEGCSP